ncbi:MAG: phosphoenolpyruvate synthase [Candidatus Buchananbacteria bacterium RIFCSPHIGHO2_02_FULL_40_13]|uniref:Phosphoenolpyruvate synthase n=1 Tax=Candidatus Buchananbacteria bacterium RIFCSPLOWO2_01_FULL_39_33 TaxID=1797543 RepID=A0A1G1YJ08_9BACT|nr:MAG: phosphoenolpyruvate synthase [Candidatus Buchananbacteria bacterium RIFCSPHIGHO2_02_FULL_40_13]OGY52254.1 MAG: phosphoenolpyruvate synthase [Candidatus Buchananbacteria bacterium RIFCSPLOWO2_01_FULL_39_33]
MAKSNKNILWFNQTTIKDIPKVGGKNASLGEMYQKLTSQGIRIPNGFAVTASAYNDFLVYAKIKKEIFSILKKTAKNNLSVSSKKIQALILKSEFSDKLKADISLAYKKLSSEYKTARADVAVRSSATAEDLPTASFAGQQESYLNIKGDEELFLAIRKCFASLFTDRAISYRIDQKFKHEKVSISVAVQKMVRSDLATAGVMFTIDTESGNPNVILINAAYGLGEYVVKGKINPDEYYVFKETLNQGFKPITSKQIGDKAHQLVYSHNPKFPTKDQLVEPSRRLKYALSDQEILTLAKWGVLIEKHYKRPMDIEWAKDGQSGQLLIVQARPETVGSQKNLNVLEEYRFLEKPGEPILVGDSVGVKIGSGPARVIDNISQLKNFKADEVLIADMTDPDWEPIMKKAAAIVTNAGGRTCFSGDTLVLTNGGFRTFEQLGDLLKKEKIFIPSLDKENLKIEWKEIYDWQEKVGQPLLIAFSQTGRQTNNCLKTTSDHKFLTWDNRWLVEKTIGEILKKQEMVLVAKNLKNFQVNKIDSKLAYLWGAIFTDGNVYLTKTHGEVQFIQKFIPAKEKMIETVQNYFKEIFNKDVKLSQKKISQGYIRGKKVVGQASTLRCYSKEIAQKFFDWKNDLDSYLLDCSSDSNLAFLAGVIDGDGSYSKNRAQIYCSDDNLLKGIIISCLKNGFLPPVTNNRNIYNIQIVEKLEEIFVYTKRVKGEFNQINTRTVFYSAKQLLGDIIDKVNYRGRIRPYIEKNLLIDSNKIRNFLIPMIFGQTANHQLTDIINSDVKMIRAKKISVLASQKVYNISVKDNHNYLVFTNRLTPLIVNNCHAAIVSRELGVPCIVGTHQATKKIKTGQEITASCAEGEIGKVYNKKVKFAIRRVDLKKLARPKTKIMMNVGNPYAALSFSFIPNDGVGLAREEFIISNYIKVHPLALLNFSQLKDQKAKQEIIKLTANHHNKPQFFVDKLAEGVGMIAAAFYPKSVIIRLSDFKSNEYANLIGGAQFEPPEPNPMIGWRGASRYYAEQYKKAFILECQALLKAREDFGLKNIKIMIPFCRTVEEGKKVIAILASHGLKQGQNGLEIYVMCEIPSNVILADEFSQIFDGFSIGSNDLTQLTLGVDRDSELVAHVYDENNQAVKDLISQVIVKAKKHKRKIGICGQAPSDFPDFARFLVREKIDSISLVPDTVVKTTLAVLAEEKKLRK